jgi:hypothetical protein
MKITERQDKELRQLVFRIVEKLGKDVGEAQRQLAPMHDAELVTGAMIAMYCCGYSPARAAAMIGALGFRRKILDESLYYLSKVMRPKEH